jgi:hypothetical protein
MSDSFRKVKSVNFHSVEDAALLAWIETLPNFSALTRRLLYQAYRQEQSPPPPTLDQIRALIRAELAGLRLADASPQAVEDDNDDELAAYLDDLF